ncbi:amid-like mitochondrial oxidoreductase [Grosmannia clavigera kw1407]|uniref:Amid-like mitochondrial oxidoreductase n=1 Tax=Grosmannia clavigera (strain kw1407 / UAMH 11150) TaxID=655863 RepID=F0XTV2_GROCL|nr:amid-like mitochondrial oxidoreductase [Grosmannia clavigera kw1407]EFW98699.1 amid-like mitochondrial oxidoreductase [Grosmannia clavigera kw1407]
MSTTKNIVILGGSYGGLSAAHCFLKHIYAELPDKENYQVVLVSIASQVTSRPAAPRAIISDDLFDQKKLWVDTAPLFENYPKGSFRFVKGTATALDHAARTVTIALAGGDDANTEVIDFYSLVIATGATTISPLMGFNHHDEVYLKERYAEFRAALAKAKSVVVCGGGATGVETAGELGEHFNGRASCWPWSGLQSKLEVTLVTSTEQILPDQPVAVAKKAEKMLANVGVKVITKTKVSSVVPEGAGTEGQLATPGRVLLSDGQELNADIYIPAIGYKANTEFVTDAALLADDGRIKTDSKSRVIGAGPRIYAIGDCSNLHRPSLPLIQAAVPVLATNMKRDFLEDIGKAQPGADREYVQDTKMTQIVPIGRSKGVGIFNGNSVPSLMVWALKGRDYWVWTTPNMWSGKQWNNI